MDYSFNVLQASILSQSRHNQDTRYSLLDPLKTKAKIKTEYAQQIENESAYQLLHFNLSIK